MNHKVGSYAVTSIDFDEWIKEEHNVKTNKTKKKNKKKIVYPLFLEYAALCDDVFWVKKFNLFASGKLPRYFIFQQHCFVYQKPSPVITCPLSGNHNEDVKTCMDFFKTYGGLFSKKDEQQYMEDELTQSMTESTTSEIVDSTSSQSNVVWTKCDKKSQELMIKHYVSEIASVMKLTIKEQNTLLQTIRLSVYCKNFNKNNIVIDNDRILEIKDLQWDKATRSFKIDMHGTIKLKKEDEDEKLDYPKDMILSLQSKFDKYHDLYDKKYQKYKL